MNFARHVKIREEKFGSAIFDTLREKVFVTNGTGRDILALLERGESPENIIQILSQDYNADSSTVKSDVDIFINQLRENGLLEE